MKTNLYERNTWNFTASKNGNQFVTMLAHHNNKYLNCAWILTKEKIYNTQILFGDE